MRYSVKNICGKLIRLSGKSLFLVLTIAALLCSGCSTQKQAATPAKAVPSLTMFSADDYIDRQNMSDTQIALIREICTWQGTPYEFGGSDKGKGADCSGLILKVFLDITEVKLPRNSAEQAEFCKHIKQSHVKPCDLVFFATGSDREKVSHVGLVLNTDLFIHSSSSKGVIITRLDNPWWHERLIGFGRVPHLN